MSVSNRLLADLAINELFLKSARSSTGHWLTRSVSQQAIEITKVGRMVFGRRDAFDKLENFTLPTLIMVGDQDIPRPSREAQLMQDAVKGRELVIVLDAGHISNLEQPDFVTEKLLYFLDKVHASLM